MQRVAWDAAHDFQRLCLFVRPGGQISFGPIRELSQVIKERIYIFIDDADECAPQIVQLIQQARRFSIRLTVFVAARVNEWNMSCEELEPFVAENFEVPYLSENEIDRLLELLEDHNALFRLKHASQTERRTAFVQQAGRQLLVALHEATLGRPFEDIIADEFAEIRPNRAKLTYLGICFLNRFDVPVRGRANQPWFSG